MRWASWGVSGSTSGPQADGRRLAASVGHGKEPARERHLAGSLLLSLGKISQLRRAHHLVAQSLLVFEQLPIDVRDGNGARLHVFDVSLEEIVNRLDTNSDRAARLVLVDILEREVRRS